MRAYCTVTLTPNTGLHYVLIGELSEIESLITCLVSNLVLFSLPCNIYSNTDYLGSEVYCKDEM